MKVDEKKCPQCAESIKIDALVCKHCSHQFSADEVMQAKEKLKGNQRIGCGLGIGLLLLLGYCVSQTPATPDNSTVSGAASQATTDLGDSTTGGQPVNWIYTDSKDEMRGTTAHHAQVDSINQVEFDFPYAGGSTATLIIRKRPQDGLQVMMSVDKGQFLCNSFSNTTVAVKFDSQPVRKFGCTDTSSGESDTIFIESPSSFLKSLKSSKKVMIEPQFYQAAGRQFTFNVEGLQWK